MENRDKTHESVYTVTKQIIHAIEGNRTEPKGNADLARLRNSLGKPFSRAVSVFPIIFSYMPDDFLSTQRDMTQEEKAILLTLQIYALHQQGKDESVVWRANEKERYHNLGHSMRVLRTEKTKAADRRFNAMVTAEDFEELAYHLRQMISLLKAKSDETVDYPMLAEDLFWFLRGAQENVRMRWAREYYRVTKKGEEDNEQ